MAQDGLFYAAIVNSVDLSTRTADVTFTDFGNSEVSNHNPYDTLPYLT